MKRLGVAALVLAASISSGCAGFPGRGGRYVSAPTTSSAAWPSILITAQTEVDRGRHADADRTLRQFAAEYPRTPEAIESTYWRAVFMLDPGNTSATARDATQLLDRYLGTEGPLAHRTEAMVFQRIAKQLVAPREAAAPATVSAPSPAPRPADPAREAEIKALKDELEQTKAELERIKKRVAPPPTPPPGTPPPV